ncbi:phage-related minor tail protein [Arthrobacter sp. 1088]|nr:phage-related minor tail protein [Arthrobacter sp. 1088]
MRASAQAIQTHLDAEAHSSQENNEARHAAEEFLRAQQQPTPPVQAKRSPAAEDARPAQEQTFQQKLAALRAKQQQQTSETGPAPAKRDDAAQAALEKLRQRRKTSKNSTPASAKKNRKTLATGQVRKSTVPSVEGPRYRSSTMPS